MRMPTRLFARRSPRRSDAGLFRDDYQDPDLLSQVFWSGVHGVAALHLIMGHDTWVQWRPVEEVAQTADRADDPRAGAGTDAVEGKMVVDIQCKYSGAPRTLIRISLSGC